MTPKFLVLITRRMIISFIEPGSSRGKVDS